MKSRLMYKFLIVYFLTCAFPVTGYGQNECVKSVLQKKFVLFDAMGYTGKPADLSSEGLVNMKVIYEGFLTQKDPKDPSKVILDLDKVKKQADEAILSNQKFICTDIEQWFYDGSMDSEKMSNGLNTMFQVFRDKIKDVCIGNYGIAPSALCVLRYYDNNKTENDSLINNWRKYNEKRWESVKNVDFIAPTVYIAEPNIDSWIEDLKTTVKEIKRHNLSKKIIVFIWPQYYDKPQSPYCEHFIEPEIWGKMLEAIYENCDGAIIWSGTEENKKIVKWDDSRIQKMMSVTKRFVDLHQIKNK